MKSTVVYGALGVVIGCTALGIFLRFTRPELTDVQALIAFWPVWAVQVMATGVLVWAQSWEE